MGLLICKRIVEKSGGHLNVTCEAEQGTPLMFSIKMEHVINQSHTELPASIVPDKTVQSDSSSYLSDEKDDTMKQMGYTSVEFTKLLDQSEQQAKK